MVGGEAAGLSASRVVGSASGEANRPSTTETRRVFSIVCDSTASAEADPGKESQNGDGSTTKTSCCRSQGRGCDGVGEPSRSRQLIGGGSGSRVATRTRSRSGQRRLVGSFGARFLSVAHLHQPPALSLSAVLYGLPRSLCDFKQRSDRAVGRDGDEKNGVSGGREGGRTVRGQAPGSLVAGGGGDADWAKWTIRGWVSGGAMRGDRDDRKVWLVSGWCCPGRCWGGRKGGGKLRTSRSRRVALSEGRWLLADPGRGNPRGGAPCWGSKARLAWGHGGTGGRGTPFAHQPPDHASVSRFFRTRYLCPHRLASPRCLFRPRTNSTQYLSSRVESHRCAIDYRCV